MIKKLQLLFVCLCSLMMSTKAANIHFLTESDYRGRVINDFDKRMKVMGMKFFAVKSLDANQEETEALKFLYAYMPMADITDYPTTFYLENIRSSFQARREMAWGSKVPELLFRHFVLPIRVNNESLDSSRMLFYKELKERIAGKSMKEAILEVNHWCHEKVTYMPSDERTSAPLATVKSAYGRCGEESTFAVAALRAVGIPARQVYTPRWAHTDDNHAWVEAWADGKWYFMGACEPEAVLNLGWFNAPASRAMLMNTRAFGHYEGPEEVMLETPNYTEINLIGNYASTARVDFRVVDENHRPVNHARVDFKIYNYGEFCPVVMKYTDSDGRTFLTAGKGDMLVWASKDRHYGYAKTSFGKDTVVTIPLTRSHSTDMARLYFPMDSMDIVPPNEHAVMPMVSEAMKKENDRRKMAEDSIRHAYMATFLTMEQAKAFAKSVSLDTAEVAPLLVMSSGNHDVVAAFLKAHAGENGVRAISLLKSLSEKDLRDISRDVLEDSYTAFESQLCPRVESEKLTPFKHFFINHFSRKMAETFRTSPDQLVKWCKEHIAIRMDLNDERIAMSPVGVWNARMADKRSRDIFFVDVARSLGIEARKDVVTMKTQYRSRDGKWIDVNFDAEKQVTAPKGNLVLKYQASPMLQDPKYYSHFTISRIENGVSNLLSYDDGSTWSQSFKNGGPLDEGTYMLVSGNRLANGSVWSNEQIFNIKKGETTTLALNLRRKDTEIFVIGSFDSESKFLSLETQKLKSVLEQTGRGYFVIGLLDVGQEPTNHALRDIVKEKESFEKWGRPILLLFKDETQMKNFKAEEFGKLPETVHFGIDVNGIIRKQIATNMKLGDDPQMPIFFTADTFNRVVFLSKGYTIGLGAQLMNVVQKLK